MFFFERIVIGFIGLGTAALFAVPASSPFNWTTHSPDAVFNLPDSSITEAKFNAQNKDLMTASFLSSVFSKINYNFNAIQAGQKSVPRLFVKKLPIDMRRIKATEQKKKLFFLSVLPLILRVNDEILAERKKLKTLRVIFTKGINLKAEDRLWLAVMESRYKVKKGDWATLARRVDIIPPSLALAQAAEESGWGTSRFVAEGNALFGQWTHGSGPGLVPFGRLANHKYKIKIFESLLDGVRAYARNLNSHQAYRSFRFSRSEMRRLGQTLGGHKISLHLLSYSQRGKKYIRSLQTIINSNSLEKLDLLKLRKKIVDSKQRFIS